jgi:hypothetical protein
MPPMRAKVSERDWAAPSSIFIRWPMKRGVVSFRQRKADIAERPNIEAIPW